MKLVLTGVESEKTVTVYDVSLVKDLSEGLNVREIAEKHKISPRTMEAQIARLKDKTDADSLPELVAIFFRNKLIE